MVTMLTIYDLYHKPFLLIALIIAAVLWELIWKGFGLWYAARKRQSRWFVAILIFNTIGILPIVYLIWFKKKFIKERTP